MSSFQKLSETRPAINGTKLKNNVPIISSGIPSLDHVIGGGLPAGSVFAVGKYSVTSFFVYQSSCNLGAFLVLSDDKFPEEYISAKEFEYSRSTEEDVLGNYSKILIKYFLAEGVACKHALLVTSAEENPRELVKELPLPCTAPPEEDISRTITNDVDRMKIAWRYEGLSQVESSFGSNTTFGHHFDLSRRIDEETIKCADILYCDLNINQDLDYKSKGFKNPLYCKLLTMIKDVISKEQYRTNSKNSNILRISIQSVGSPVWLSMDCGDDFVLTSYGQDLMKFMYCLRILLRDTNAVAFVTIPSHLFDDGHIMKRIVYSVDNAVRIESFAGSSRETNPVYKDYHGLFHITKLSALYTLVPFVPPSLDLAFKLKRKKFIIEKLHLPPELQESSEREQDDITATPPVNCGGFNKKHIDF